ncbi:hypothetical protein PN836_004980 [Ningiella sp. W23]|uniref:hypothetical protein n=1 Tax=Ningiella sp. W23 TaxID=3023715 RepID=UPI003756DA12
MAIKLALKDECRLVPVRFERASKSEPDIQFPDIDNRGYRNKDASIDGVSVVSNQHTALLSLSAGQSATIKLVRENIAPTAPLFVSSSNSDCLSVISPTENAKCADGPFSLIKIEAQLLETNKTQVATLEVRFGRADGPIIHRLDVYVLPKLIIKIQPFLVTINGENGASGKAVRLNLSKVFSIASAIWGNAGIQLSFAKPISLSASLRQADKMSCNSHLNEMNRVLDLKWEADRVNLYIMQEVEGGMSITVNAQDYRYLKLIRPGIFFGLHSCEQNQARPEEQVTNRASDAHLCGNDLAHELGHFFALPHSGAFTNHDSPQPEDTWSMRSIMHETNTIVRNVPNGASVADFNDLSYGFKNEEHAYRGALVPIKRIGANGNDASCDMARKYIAKGIKHLYS